MAAIPVGKGRHEDGVGGRCGVGGGGPWRRAKGQPDSQMRARGQEWTQADLAPQVFELEEASRSLWPGRGVGRGPLWVEGGENGRKGFRENAGWTGDFARGARAVPARPHRGAALAGEDGAACGEPAVGAVALLDVFRSIDPGLALQVRVSHRFSLGRGADCDLTLKWDGVSKRHLYLEALYRDEPSQSKSKVRPGGSVAWFVSAEGSNGTFLNKCKIAKGKRQRLKDGDVIGIGKGAAVGDGETIPNDKDLLYMFVFRQPGAPKATPLPGSLAGGLPARPATAGALNDGHNADAHDKCQGLQHHPSKSVCFAPSSYTPHAAADNKGADVSLELDFVYGYASGGQPAETARSNLFYTVQGKLAYPAGTLGIVYDPRSHSQEYFTEHDAAISVMAMHPNRRFVASAGVASQRRLTSEGRPSVSIMVWDATKSPPGRVCKPLARQHQYEIHALAFTSSGKRLVSMGGDSKYTTRVIIYDWARAGLGVPGEMPGKVELGIMPLRDGPCIIPGGGGRSLFINVNPYTADTALDEDIKTARADVYGETDKTGRAMWPRQEQGDAFHFVQCVDKATKMWNLGKVFESPTRAARTMTGFTTPQKGLAGAWCPPSFFPEDGRPADPVAAVGLELGDIYFFQLVGTEITVTNKLEMAHEGQVLSMCFVVKVPPSHGEAKEAGEQLLVSGGRDGKVRAWDPKLSWKEPVMEFDLGSIVPHGTEHRVAVRALDYNRLTNKMLVGTSINAIYELDLSKLSQGQANPCVCLVDAHMGAVLSLAPVPNKSARRKTQTHDQEASALTEDFVTCSLDGTFRFWCSEQRRQTRCRVTGLEARAIDVSSDASLVAVGHSGGQFSVWETARLQCIYVNSHTAVDIGTLRFSPNSLALAVVTNRRELRLYDCTRYAVQAPRGQEEEFYGDGKIKAREKVLRRERNQFMMGHKGMAQQAALAPQAQVKLGARLNPEVHARHLVRAPPTSRIAEKVGCGRSARANAEADGHDGPVLPGFKMLACCPPKHATTITHLDFSADSCWLRSSDAGGEVWHWRVAGLTHEPRTHALRDTPWASFSVPLCWHLSGIWSQHNKVHDVATADVCHLHGATAVGFDNGKVGVFAFPCVGKETDRQIYSGHASRVASARWFLPLHPPTKALPVSAWSRMGVVISGL